MQGLERLDGKEIGDRDRSQFRNPPKIVAHQIDDHQVFSTAFNVAGEMAAYFSVAFIGSSAWRCPFHRPGPDDAATLFYEKFGGRRQNGDVASIDQAAICDALLQAQIAVQRERRALEIELGFERQVELIDVARANVLNHLVESLKIGAGVPGVPKLDEKRIADGFGIEPTLNFRA